MREKGRRGVRETKGGVSDGVKYQKAGETREGEKKKKRTRKERRDEYKE